MAESTKRWNQISEHLDDIDINYSRFDEIDGRNMSPVKIITVATHNDGYYQILQESSKRNGFELITLAMGEKWTGFSMKPRLLKEYLSTLDPNEIIIHCDAFDVIVNGSSDELIERFNRIDKTIVYGTENMNESSGLDVKLFAYLGFPSCGEHILNSGTVVAKVESLLDLINLTCEQEGCESGDDQVKLNNVCNKEKQFFEDNVYIDVDSRFIMNGGCENTVKYLRHLPCNFDLHYDKKENKMRTEKGYNPILIHGNGNVNIDEICSELGYDVSTVVKRKDYTTFLLKQHKTKIQFLAFFLIAVCITFLLMNKKLNNYIKLTFVVVILYLIRVIINPLTWVKDFSNN